MHFCSKCGNMYYIKLDNNENDIIYYCRKCGNEDMDIGRTTIVVSKTILNDSKKNKHNIINEYTDKDPRIPHLYNIACVNDDCESNQENSGVSSDVLYIRYNTEDMKYLYLCSYCKTVWSNESN